MNMQQAIVNVFNNYANFGGRARRSEYWYFILFNMLVNLVFGVLVSMVKDGSAFYRMLTGLNGLYDLAVFVPLLAVTWRRLHDIGKSGANWFWNFLPLIGQILLLIWYVREGDAGSNQYGPDPKRYDDYNDPYHY